MNSQEPHHLPHAGEPIDDSDLGERAELEQIGYEHALEEEAQWQAWLHPTPGETEPAALLLLARRGAFFGWLGIVLAGALFATPFFPCIGTWFGGMVGGVMGIGPTLAAALLFGVLRGRLPMPTAMAWAGGVTGFLGIRAMGMPTGRLLADPMYVAMACAPSLCGALCARWVCGLGLHRYVLAEGLGSRGWRQYSIIDLLLITTLAAVLATTLRFALPDVLSQPEVLVLGLLISIGSAAVAEFAATALRRRRKKPNSPSPE